MNSERKSTTLPVIFLTIFLDLLGIGILIPVIPLLLADPQSAYFLLPTGYSPEQGYILLGILLGVYPLMQFFATPILGQLSDRFGRKKILFISLCGTCISYLVFAFGILTRNIPLLFAARALDGITGGNISVAQAAIADVTTPENRAKNFGLIGAAFGIGFILGPYIGGKLSDPTLVSWFNAATPFWFAALLSLCNILSVWFFFPETLKNPATHITIQWKKSIHNIIKAFSFSSTKILFITAFFFSAGFAFFTTFFSVSLIHKFGFTQGNIGDFFAYLGVWIAFTQGVLTRNASKYFKEYQILRWSFIGAGLFMFLFLVPNIWWGLLLVAPFFSIANGLSQTNLVALVSRSADPSIQGEVLGINASVQALAQSIPPILSGYIAASLSAEAPILVLSLVMVFAGMIFIVWYRPNHSPVRSTHV